MATSQHRCVFVGNIPYDATEEQLIEICREVGPVVSFRLVIDRETGKPKGYGFCEYKDEETALSARRNLQGYAINGRQLRVDFAENDKGADRNREQCKHVLVADVGYTKLSSLLISGLKPALDLSNGRGGPGLAGPGLAANVDPQKQLGGPAIHGESVHHQPIGLHLAITAASVLSGALGGAQAGIQSSPNVIQNQLASANDPLTLHLAKMSRIQLNEIMSDLKLMASQNKESARQLLLAKPQLLKAIFQAQIMLGMVSPQVLQMPNLRQGPVQSTLPSLQDGQQGQQPAVQLPGLPPLSQKMQLVPKLHEGQMLAVPQNSLLHNQFSAPLQPTMRPQIQPQQQANNQVLHQATLHGQSGVSTLPSIHPSARPQIQVANSSSLNQQIQPSSLENQGQVAAASMGINARINLPNAAVRSSLLPRPPSSDTGFQPGPSISSGIAQTVSMDADRSAGVPDDASWVHRNNAYSKKPIGLAEKTSMVHNSSDSINRPSKIMKLDDKSSTSFSMGALNASKMSGTGPSQAFGAGLASVNPIPKIEEVQPSERQISQQQLPADVESALLQQVMSLTPEQLSSLPPEQRQQVIQLQQALLHNQMQPS
ncbi:hypothetical protein EZV62_022373 [Acer yangbiense]|uniref:RRM domain-containing protein n=1 Tax=Acer yangbiense TaxID=1000413 RepID=A0A5C7H8F5_9ROSI|nr:hypothetical protein EZV62_022373 [Acer yangbiense]